MTSMRTMVRSTMLRSRVDNGLESKDLLVDCFVIERLNYPH